MRRPSIFLPILISLLSTLPIHARIIHVPGDKATIQGGINVSANGDTVMVHPGTYYEHDIDFHGKAITVTGTDPEDSTVVATTIVDGEDTWWRLFFFHSGEGASSRVSGLTMTNADAEREEGIPARAIECLGASPTISYNRIHHNEGYGIRGTDSSPRIIHNAIMHNLSVSSYGENLGGGGIRLFRSRSIIANNRLIYNDDCSEYCGPTGGINTVDSSPIILNNEIRVNSGGIRCNGGKPFLANNRLLRNYNSGGIYCNGVASAVITHNVIEDNTARFKGGGIRCDGSTAFIADNVISANTAEVEYPDLGWDVH